MIRGIQPSILVFGAKHRASWEDSPTFCTARTPREMIATIRLADFDLTVLGLETPNLNVWELMHDVIQLWPRFRWMIASERITARDEVVARSLGAVMVLNTMPDDHWLEEFAVSFRQHDRSRSVPFVPVDQPVPLSHSA